MTTQPVSVKKYYWAALGLQVVMLLVCIALHRIFIHIGSQVEPAVMVGSEMSDPTVGRLIYAILSGAAFIALSVAASREAGKGKNYVPFILGTFAGTFLWQCLGEDLWNFTIGGMHFILLEGIEVWPLTVLYLLALIYCRRRKSLDWGIWCVVLSFGVNWLGHYILLGFYPLFAALISARVFCMTVGLTAGLSLMVIGLYLGIKKSEKPRQKMLSALLTFFAAALLAFGLMGG